MDKRRILFFVGLMLIILPLEWGVDCCKSIKIIIAPYHQTIEATLLDVSPAKPRSSDYHSPLARLTDEAYVTLEEYKLGDEIRMHEGYYETKCEPGYTVSHNIYSYDNVDWHVYDFNRWLVLTKGIIATICSIVGIIFVVRTMPFDRKEE